jgi:hypothetical protein
MQLAPGNAQIWRRPIGETGNLGLDLVNVRTARPIEPIRRPGGEPATARQQAGEPKRRRLPVS